MSNDHLDRAKSRLHNGTNNEVSRAQAEATLALAYEQRTANLIALIPHAVERERLEEIIMLVIPRLDLR